MIDPRRRAIAIDIALYAGGAVFAAVTAATSTLVPHRAWGSIAWIGYAVAALASALLLIWYRPGARLAVTLLGWIGVALVPVVVQSVQRAGGRTDRAQDEVIVVEASAERVLDTGSPYLARDVIATLPPEQWLISYAPYQPWMAVFGLPRAVFGVAWWTDARIWFALAVAVLLAAGLRLLRRVGEGPLTRVAQSATIVVLPALALSTGGQDLPVLGLCLVGFAFAWHGRLLPAGIAIGIACGMRFHVWPVAVVLLALAIVHRQGWRYALPAFALPVLALVPPLLIDADALYEHVVRFPLLDKGLVSTPAQSPLPGRLLMLGLGTPGRVIAALLLLAVAVAIGVRLLRRPPRGAAEAALLCAIGTGAAILLSPHTRFGHLLYPVAFLMWLPALRSTQEE